ncbi:hypothetical protein [Saccharopolyspora sp. CA-218241]|uniref:hypothetical protein n=1 Tax=Saccharopolyspora sp. CA-218241 TaxID=3240027 RepID=UPI003D994935
MSGPPEELRALREIFQSCDPVPQRAVDAAYAAVRFRSGTSTSALELVADSVDEPAPVRSWGPASRVLTFLMPGRIVELELVPTVPGLYRVSGLVINRAGQSRPGGRLAVRHPAGERAAELDEHGAFAVPDVPRGPISVVFQAPRSAPAIADWLVC